MRKLESAEPRKRRTFYLPGDVDALLEERATKDGRSVSNFLTSMLRKALADG